MPKVAKIDRAGLRSVQDQVMTALKAIEAELGVTFTMGKGRFSNTETGATEISFACAAPDGTSQSIGEIDFRRHAAAMGLKPDDFGRQFTSGGNTYKIAGLVPSSRKYPILGERADGSKFKFTLDTVTLCFKAEEAAKEAEKREIEERKEREARAEAEKAAERLAEERERRAREEAEKAEDEMWVAPPRPERVSDAAKAMQDRLFG